MAYGQRDSNNPNRWRARYKRADGTMDTKSGFSSKTAAKQWGDEQEALIRRRLWIDPKEAETPYGEVAEKWYDTFSKILAKSTLAKYRAHLDNHLLPQWETWPVIGIFNGYVDIQDWVGDLHDDYEESTVSSIFATFSTTLMFAVKDKKIPSNPCNGVRVTTGEYVTDRLVATPVQALRAAMRLYTTGMGFAGFVLCLPDFYTGGRRSELVGQQRHEYNEMKRALVIREPLKEVSGAVSKSGRTMAADDALELTEQRPERRRRRPKRNARTETPAGTREVELPPSIAVFYEMLMDAHANLFVICTPEGRALRRSNFRQRYWRPVWDGIEPDRPNDPTHVPALLPWFTFNEGRHTHSTWLAEDNICEVARRARLGQMMKGMGRVYDHVTPEMRAQILEVLEARWFTSLVALTSAERRQLAEWFPHLEPALAAAAEQARRGPVTPNLRQMIFVEHEKRPTKIVGRPCHQRI
jgi:integrase